MMIGNGIGIGLQEIYIAIYLWYFVKKANLRIPAILIAIVITLGIFAGFFWGISVWDNRVTGKCAMVFNIIMYAAPGQNLVRNI
jgi:hypothetical protein